MAIEDAPALADERAIVVAAPAAEQHQFEDAIVTRIPNPNQLPGAAEASRQDDRHGIKRGLSVYMLGQNKYLEDAKKAKGRNLTPDE
eukprot:1225866-Pyramimonas_sp.AAC.1